MGGVCECVRLWFCARVSLSIRWATRGGIEDAVGDEPNVCSLGMAGSVLGGAYDGRLAPCSGGISTPDFGDIAAVRRMGETLEMSGTLQR